MNAKEILPSDFVVEGMFKTLPFKHDMDGAFAAKMRKQGKKLWQVKRRKIWMTIGIGLGIIFITAFLTSQIIFPLIFRTPKNVEVPNVVGLSLPMAKLRLTQLGLHIVVRIPYGQKQDNQTLF